MRITESRLRRIIRSVLLEVAEDEGSQSQTFFASDEDYNEENLNKVIELLQKIKEDDKEIQKLAVSVDYKGKFNSMWSKGKLIRILNDRIENECDIELYRKIIDGEKGANHTSTCLLRINTKKVNKFKVKHEEIKKLRLEIESKVKNKF